MLAKAQVLTFDATQAQSDAVSVRALHEQLANVRERYGHMQVELGQERSAANYFESKLISATPWH
eukprot:1487193-Prymnesium_polylepis.1